MRSYFALPVRSTADLLGFVSDAGPDDESGPASLLIELAGAGEVRDAFSGPLSPPAISQSEVEGAPWIIERGVAADVRITYGHRAEFHLDAAATRILCAPADRSDARWQRALLDSGLTTAALQRGHEALHAGAVVVDGEAVAITGPSGAGKTTLLLELLSRGHRLLSDDILVLTNDAGQVLAHPGPPLMNIPAAAQPTAYGDVLGELDDGAWVQIAGAASEPVKLAAIYLLQRAEGETDRVVDVPDPSPILLGVGLDSGSSPQRRVARLDLLSAVAGSVPVRCLIADPTASPAKLANMIEC